MATATWADLTWQRILTNGLALTSDTPTGNYEDLETAATVLAEHGAFYEPQPVPRGWRRYRLRSHGRCFEAAGRTDLNHRAAYVEGVAFATDAMVAYAHAWNYHPDDGVIDLSTDLLPNSMFGLEIPHAVSMIVGMRGGRWNAVLVEAVRIGWRPGVTWDVGDVFDALEAKRVPS